MPSVRVRRKSVYSPLSESIGTPDVPALGSSTLSPSLRSPRDLAEDSFLYSGAEVVDQAAAHPRLSSLVYHAARHNSFTYRSRSSAPLSEQGAPHPRARSYTTGVRPASRDIFNPPQDTVLPPSIHHGPTGDEENQHAQLLGAEYASDEETDELLHDEAIVDHLDVIDPGVATVGVLTNAANAIVFPPVSVYSRKPIVTLQSADNTATRRHFSGSISESHEIDAHVDEVLTKRAKFKRILRGVWSFLKTPMGILVGVYGFLVAFWGTAIVLFLLKWINLHNEDDQGQWVELCCQIENTLFCITGLGIAPWRILDTYRIAKIWWYKRRTLSLREKAGYPPLFDDDDLPDPQYNVHYVHVLNEREQADLHKQQIKFMQSQTWYRPHGTATHRAFPIDYGLAICSLNVGNSIFQAMLAACMWSMDRFTRPAWTTGTLIPCAFLCGIFSGVLIWRGGQLTKRTAHVEKCLRDALAARITMDEDKDRSSPSLTAPIYDERTGVGKKEATSHSPVLPVISRRNTRLVRSPEPFEPGMGIEGAR